ncbi:MAG: hypothetical protein HY318_15395 [Armatimonadetes bacterium]|nr:hypothetical protein [Armatimonadota bacterium]
MSRISDFFEHTMAVTVKFYPEGQLSEPLSRAIRTAKRSVDMVYFYWKTQYATFTPANAIVKAAQDAAKKEGVRVRVLLGYGADAPSVQYLNYLTAKALAESGIEVRLAPVSRTTHAKMTVIDGYQTFLGSHNITRGTLSFNKELIVGSNTRDMCCRPLAGRYRRISPFVTSPATSSSWTFEIVRNCW